MTNLCYCFGIVLVSVPETPILSLSANNLTGNLSEDELNGWSWIFLNFRIKILISASLMQHLRKSPFETLGNIYFHHFLEQTAN